MEKKITLFHGSEKIIEYQTYLEMMDDETDGIYINKASAESLYKISRVLGCCIVYIDFFLVIYIGKNERFFPNKKAVTGKLLLFY